jgi:hypothetical protein
MSFEFGQLELKVIIMCSINLVEVKFEKKKNNFYKMKTHTQQQKVIGQHLVVFRR